MNNDTLFYSTNISNNLIEAHRVNFHTNENCMNNIVKIGLNNFWISHNKDSNTTYAFWYKIIYPEEYFSIGWKNFKTSWIELFLCALYLQHMKNLEIVK